jgi:hypothetical protein
LSTISVACAGVTRGTLAFAASIIAFTLVAMVRLRACERAGGNTAGPEECFI